MTDITWGPEIAVDTKGQARFWRKVSKGPAEQCWPWTAYSISERGRQRGMFTYRNRCLLAHRVAAALVHGLPQSGQVCMHSCDNPMCCNPAHLRWGTQAENMRECSERGRAGNTKKTFCPRGHEYTPENTRIRKSGRRSCRQCGNIRGVAYRASVRARLSYPVTLAVTPAVEAALAWERGK